MILKWFAFLAFVALPALAVEDETIQIPLEHHMETNQARRLVKLSRSVRTLPKNHQKLVEYPFMNEYLTVNLTFGSPEQGPFRMMLSTGATTAWVFGKDCNQPGHPFYTAGASNLYKDLKDFYSTRDDFYNVQGEWTSDQMHYGTAIVKGQAFGVINKISKQHESDFQIDGVLGINHWSPDVYKEDDAYAAPIDNLLQPLPKKIVSIYLDKQVPPSKGFSKGTLTLGGVDKKNCDFTGDVVSIPLNAWPVTQDDRFTVDLTSLKFKDYSSDDPRKAYFDTSMSTLQMTYDDIDAIYNTVIKADYDWNTGLYLVSCNTKDDLPVLDLNFNGKHLKVYPNEYALDLDLPNNKCALVFTKVDEDIYQNEETILGMPIFHKYCVAYDFDNNNVMVYNHLF